jgi:signal transduction histidine kinase
VTRWQPKGRDSTEAATEKRAVVPLSHGLSLKLLLLTIIFVLIAEVVIFMPSIASYRLRWLEERLGTAAALSLVLVERETARLSRGAEAELLDLIGADAIALRDGDASRLLASRERPADRPLVVHEHVDLDGTGPLEAVAGALDTLVSGGDRTVRVFGRVGDNPGQFELVLPDRRLREAMLDYSQNIALLAALISLLTALLVYGAIDRIMIRPIRAMTRSMLRFAENPDDASRIVRPGDRSDEIGVAERELSDMQARLRRMLAEQKHLADLGLAVSKINHDMRNMLSSAQLLSDRLRKVEDPTAQSLAPKLLRALDRAVSYSENVLAYGRAQEAPPQRRRLRLRLLVDEVLETAALDAAERVEFVNAVDPGLEIDADAEQLFRILSNLCRNAVQAMTARLGAASEGGSAVVRRLTVDAERQGSVARVRVEDTGPGLPRTARENLFSAFRGSARSGGTGLGLAIAQELARAHGGTVELEESVGGRTVFAISIPDQPIRLDEARPFLRRPA